MFGFWLAPIMFHWLLDYLFAVVCYVLGLILLVDRLRDVCGNATENVSGNVSENVPVLNNALPTLLLTHGLSEL